jgi:hypothetical protein
MEIPERDLPFAPSCLLTGQFCVQVFGSASRRIQGGGKSTVINERCRSDEVFKVNSVSFLWTPSQRLRQLLQFFLVCFMILVHFTGWSGVTVQLLALRFPRFDMLDSCRLVLTFRFPGSQNNVGSCLTANDISNVSWQGGDLFTCTRSDYIPINSLPARQSSVCVRST